MDWGVIAQAMFFLAIGFIAIIVTMFVFATSLLSLARKKASYEKRKILEEQEQRTSVELEKIQQQLNKAKKANNSEEIEKLGKEVSKLENQLRMDEQSLASILKRYSLPFTVGTGVARPGICFLLASTLSGIAWSLGNRQSQVGIGFQNTLLPFLTYLLIGLALIAIIYGVYKLYYNLKAIQEVSISSEELDLGKTTEAVKIAYKEYTDENRPKMELEFIEPKPPIQIAQRGEVTIKFKVRLVKGDQGQNARVVFYAPDTFNFIPPTDEKPFWYLLMTDPGNIAIEHKMGKDLYPGDFYFASLTIEAPQETGTFKLYYKLQCIRFNGPYKHFEVLVTT